MEDADVDLAADLIVKSQVCNTGQTCIVITVFMYMKNVMRSSARKYWIA